MANYGIIDRCTGGTATADSEFSGTFSASKAFDDNDTTRWTTTVSSLPHWIKYDFGVGVSWGIGKLRLKPFAATGAYIKDFTLQGSNNDSDWDVITTEQATDDDNWQEFLFSNSTKYRYYMINITTTWHVADEAAALFEVEMFEILYAAFLLNMMR